MAQTPSSSSHVRSMSSNPSIQDTSEMSKGSDNEIDDVEVITSKDRRRAEAWNHFTIEKQPDGTSKAICKYCEHRLSCAENSGTSHLNRHLTVSCKKKPHKDMKQMLLPKVFKFDQQVSRKCLAKLVICAELPFKMVEHPVFANFVRSLQPLFSIKGRHTVRNDCIALFQEEKQKLHCFMKKLECRVSFTIDMWTSNQKLGYMALTAHYVDEEFVLQKKILNFRKVPYPHTGFALNDVLGNCLTEWNLDGKLFAITADNCSTNDVLIRNFRKDFGEKLLFSGDHIHIRCCAHILNIMVQDGLKVMDESIKHIRNLITHVVSSPSRMQIFNEIAQLLKLPTKKGLILDVATRWNSTYEMLNNAISYKHAFIRYADEHYMGIDVPINDDWKKAEMIMIFLKTFVDTTEVFSGCKYSTSNLYFKEIWTIRNILQEEATNGEEIVKTLAVEMQKKFKKYWDECNKILSVASILDPRSKLAYIEYKYMAAFGDEISEKKVKELRDFFYKMYDQYERVAKQKEPDVDMYTGATSAELTTSSSHVGLGKRRSDLDMENFWSQNAMKRAKRNEVDSYLEESLHPPMSDMDFNILEWWKKHATLYPVLSKMARDVLAIPVSTVPSESAFSSGGRVVDQYRSRLSPTTVEALICTQDWLRNEYYIDDSEVSLSSSSSCLLDEELVYQCLAE